MTREKLEALVWKLRTEATSPVASDVVKDVSDERLREIARGDYPERGVAEAELLQLLASTLLRRGEMVDRFAKVLSAATTDSLDEVPALAERSGLSIDEVTTIIRDADSVAFDTRAAEPAPPDGPCCPGCGCADTARFTLRETFIAFHPIKRIEDDAIIVENALGTDCPSKHFDDGAADYQVHCGACDHTADAEDFNMPSGPQSVDWE